MADPLDPQQALLDLDERLASEDPRSVLASLPDERTGDAREVAVRLASVWVLCELGRTDEAREASARAVSLSRKLEARPWIARSVAASAWVSWTEGDAAGAVQLARRARAEAPDDAIAGAVTRLMLGAHARRAGEVRAALELLTGEGPSAWFGGLLRVARVEALTAVGDLDGARRLLADAFERTGDRRRVIHAWLVVALAELTRASGDHQSGREAVDLELASLAGLRVAPAAELHLLRGAYLLRATDLDGALEAHGQAVEILESLGHPRRHAARMSQVLTALQAGHAELARDLLGRVSPRAVPAEEIAALRGAVAAASDDAEGWAHHHERARLFLAGTRAGSEDQARALDVAAERWEASALPDSRRRAFRARALALQHWERLGRPERMSAAVRRLRTLGDAGVPIPAGPYDLSEELGTGAMGKVWLGRHHVHGGEVAVKVLRMDATHDEFLRSSFDAEIRAVAALEHPGIVQILGHGVLDHAAALAGDPKQAGAPWFAMELVSGGTLHDVCGRLRWSACRGVLQGLLDALAHAHARDVLHLDIKPANVLLEPVGDQRVRPRLADFGLSGLAADGRQAAGTPHYMAPEQFRGRDLGPWTDLYAVGCLAWALVSGRPPFDSDDLKDLRNAHMAGALPPFDPVVAVPERFDRWLEKLLEKDPTERFESAADAAWMLHTLQDPETDEPPRAAPLASPLHTSPITFSLPVWSELRSDDVVQATDAPLRLELPPMPVSWKAVTVERPKGVEALELYHLRRPPLVGRVRQRDLLWATLSDVKRRGRPRFVSLEGLPGTGRSHLARWFLETARERGAARCFSARFVTDASGLAPVIRRALRAEELRPEHLRARLAPFAEVLDEARIDALVAVAGGRAPVEADLPGLARLLEALAHTRPVVLWLEGRPAGQPLAVELTRLLLAGVAPVLVVFEATPGEDREADRRYEEILDLPPTTAVTLEPLGPKELRELARELLSLDPGLIDRIVDRAPDDADLVVATISDLVRRDALREDAHGLVLREGHDLAPAATLLRAWVDRLETLLEEAPLAARDALGACAVAGTEVMPDAWRAVCEEVGLAAPSNLIRALRTQRLIAAASHRAWTFTHWSIPLHLREEAMVDGRLPRLSRIAARHLRFDDLGRLGTALLDAGVPDEALEPLGEALRDALARTDVGRASELCDALEGALRVQGVDESEPRWLGVHLSRSHLLRLQGRREAAMELAVRCATRAAGGQEPSLLFQALSLVSALQAEAGDGVGSTATLKRALGVARSMGDPSAVARVRLAVADAARQRGDLEGAARHYDRGLKELEQVSDRRTQSALKLGLGRVQAARGALDQATATLHEAMEALEASGDADGACQAGTALGRIACRQGNTRRASRLFASALDHLPPTDRARRAHVLLDQCLAMATDGRWEDLEAHAQAVLDETPGLPLDTKTWAFALLVAARADGSEDGFDATVDTLEGLLRQTVLVDADVALVLESAAERAPAGPRARRCWTLAEAQWRTLGDRDRARRARELARGGSDG